MPGASRQPRHSEAIVPGGRGIIRAGGLGRSRQAGRGVPTRQRVPVINRLQWLDAITFGTGVFSGVTRGKRTVTALS